MPMQFQVREAKRKGQWARIGLIGPPGAGKSFTALRFAKGLTRNGKVCAIDTERGSLDKYADAVEGFKFDKIDLPNFSPETYTEAIKFIEGSGYDTVIIDSLSHGWTGPGGELEMVDEYAKRARSGNAFTTGWKEVTPMHHKLVDAMLMLRGHLVVTMRSKVEYVLEKNDEGKVVPRKVGLAPVQKADMEFEFDLTGMMDQDHYLTVTKTRYPFMDNGFIKNPGVEIGVQIKEWLDGNEPQEIPTGDLLQKVGYVMKLKGIGLDRITAAGYKNPRELAADEIIKLLAWMEAQ